MVSTVAGGSRITDGAVKNENEALIMPLNNSFSEGAKAFDGFPVLLYDGPFSDQVLNKKSALVSAGSVISKEDASHIVQRTLDVSKNRLSFETEDKSKIPCFTFRSGRYTVSVTRQGGYIKNMLYSGMVTGVNISEEEAIRKAKAFLKSLGYTDMKESYYSNYDNICTINFAYAKDGVYCYSDLIKAGVSLDTGKVLTLDAATYLTNHTERNTFRGKISRAQAEKKLSPYVKVKSVKRCVIPKENGSEKQCYEFLVTGKDTGEDALIYINSDTGEEEDIMLLLYTDNGTMVK
jgi:germination protein YpeB